jgi:hypothetical protein
MKRQRRAASLAFHPLPNGSDLKRMQFPDIYEAIGVTRLLNPTRLAPRWIQ